MTQETSPAEPPVAELKSFEKKQVGVEEIVESLKSVGADIGQINQLASEEQLLVAQFLELLEHSPQQVFSMAVSASELPVGIGAVTQAYVNSTGHLVLTFEDERMAVMDLREAKTRDFLMAVTGGVAPQFQHVVRQIADEPIQVSPPVQEMSPPEPLPAASAVEPVGLGDSEAECVQEEPPVSSTVDAGRVEELAAEVLASLEQLGSQVFECSPVSVCFADWLVSLRQVLSKFESNPVIGVDEAFTSECSRVFSVVEGELAKRRLEEAELEASAGTLAESKQFLEDIDAEYTAQIRDLVVKGKSVIDFLTKTVHDLEEQLAEIRETKAGRLHPLKRRANERQQLEVTLKLNAAKKRLALAVQHSAVEQEKLGALDAEYAAQASALAAKRQGAIDFLTKNVHDLEKELAKLNPAKAGRLHPFKKRTLARKQVEVAHKLEAATKRLALAKHHCGAEQKRIREEYEAKKQAAIAEVQRLEEEISCKEIDGSLEARQAAANALANAVQALVQRKTASSQ